jgi:hypothetical protein
LQEVIWYATVKPVCHLASIYWNIFEMARITTQIIVEPTNPDFKDLPWDLPLEHWHEKLALEDNLPRGISRHPVVFLRYQGNNFAFKELPPDIAETEYDNLVKMKNSRLPVVNPVGFAKIDHQEYQTSVLISSFLDRSIPYHTIFAMEHMTRYRRHLLNAMASLMVELHLAGIFWGDCSLSNTLFRRDAGELQAYLVDAETSLVFNHELAPVYRYDDLKIMKVNLERDISEQLENQIQPANGQINISDYILTQYQKLWDEITGDILIRPGENYKVQERIRAINSMGFSVGSIELVNTEGGENLRLHVVVTDRNYHRDELLQQTGLHAEEMQARQLINELYEMKAMLSWNGQRNISLEDAARYWYENLYQPTMKKLEPYITVKQDPVEIYCQILENKWYLSEQARHDVGHAHATEDYIQRHIVYQND